MRRTYFLTSLIHFVIGLTEIILLTRIVLRLFAANPTASFVHWVFTTSDTLLAPFRGIFPTTVITKGFVVDFTALFALVIYALLGALLAYLANMLERSVAVNDTPPTRSKRV